MDKNIRLFCVVCFAVLMENGMEGVTGKSPRYVREKYLMHHNAWVIWNGLHTILKSQVIAWGKKWGEDFEVLVNQMNIDIQKLSTKEFDKIYVVYPTDRSL